VANTAAPGFALLTVQASSTQKDGHASVDWDLTVYDKAATRMAESLWFSFAPKFEDQTGWEMHKLGRWIDPMHARYNGSATLHSLWEGVRHLGSDTQPDFKLQTVDAPVVSPGYFLPTGAFGSRPAPERGWNFCLFNNAWNTNYALWAVDREHRFRWSSRLRL